MSPDRNELMQNEDSPTVDESHLCMYMTLMCIWHCTWKNVLMFYSWSKIGSNKWFWILIFNLNSTVMGKTDRCRSITKHNQTWTVCMIHCSDIKLASRHINSPTSQLFVQQLVPADTKGIIKAPCHWPFVRGSTSDRWNPFTNGQ